MLTVSRVEYSIETMSASCCVYLSLSLPSLWQMIFYVDVSMAEIVAVT